MRIALISDIHANLEALEAVLADIRQTGVDQIYCLGDVIGYGAEPKACLDLVLAHCSLIVRGNHEEALLRESYTRDMSSPAAKALAWTQRQLSPADLKLLDTWPLVKVGADARVVHASPAEPIKFKYAVSRLDCEFAFRAFTEKVCFFGHSHIPLAAEEMVPGVMRWIKSNEFQLDPQSRYLVNVGSVGQPRDGNPKSRWVLVEDEPAQISIKSVAYDILKTQKKIIKAGLPKGLAERLALGQ
jgi:predicted phosphodiesterase